MTKNRICSTESRIEDRCKNRSSSEEGIDQLFFGQFALDKLFKEEPRISSLREAFQTKVRHSVLDGLTPEKAFRDSYCPGCCRNSHCFLDLSYSRFPLARCSWMLC